MKKQITILITLLLLIIPLELFSKNYVIAQPGERITIHPNGSIECLDQNQIDNIQQNGDTYTFKANIKGYLIIEKEKAKIDGADFTLQGEITINADQVTITNMKIRSLAGTAIEVYSSDCKIIGNEIIAERKGLKIRNSDNNIISNNIFDAKVEYCIEVGDSSNNVFSENNITARIVDGVHLTYSNHNTFSRNNITFAHIYGSSHNTFDKNNFYEGISIRRSSNSNNITRNSIIDYNFLEDNTIVGSGSITLEGCNNNFISSNTLANSGGIFLHDSSNNVLRNNSISTDSKGFEVIDAPNPTFSSAINDIDSSNTINGKSIYYLIGETDLVISSTNYPEPAYLALINCSQIIIKDLNFETQGILLAWTNDSLITNNNIVKCQDGVFLNEASNNYIINNNISSNAGAAITFHRSNQNFVSGNTISQNNLGLHLYSSENNNTITNNHVSNNNLAMNFHFSSNNNFYNNNFINNIELIYDYYYDMKDNPFYYSAPSVGIWDSEYAGNYWSSYNDQNPSAKVISESNIWDTPFIIDENNTDPYPLVNPVSISSVPIPTNFIPTSTSSATSTPSASPEPTNPFDPQQGVFRLEVVAGIIAIITIVSIGVFIFFKKYKRK